MKKLIMIIIVICSLSGKEAIFCQRLTGVDFLKLSLEDKLEYFFRTFRDGHTSFVYPSLAGDIVRCHGTAVIPYLKEYVKDADLFTLRINPSLDENPDFYLGEPNNITLELVAFIWYSFYLNADIFPDPATLKPFQFDENEIQWFVDEYKQRIDEYVTLVRTIDETMAASERMLYMITGYGRNSEGPEKYGHPNLSIVGYNYCGWLLKEYYEQRLGISNLEVDYTYFIE